MKKCWIICIIPALLAACSEPAKKEATAEKKSDPAALTDPELISRGKYLVSITGCHDCHSPKLMTPEGPVPDTSRLLSGHPSDMPVAPYDTGTSKNWVLFNMMNTAIKGPWGISFAANLTPDDQGIGNWSEEHFSTAMREGFYKGIRGGRKLLPPMPWQTYSVMKDEDVHAIFAYLKSLKPIANKVPAPIPPGS